MNEAEQGFTGRMEQGGYFLCRLLALGLESKRLPQEVLLFDRRGEGIQPDRPSNGKIRNDGSDHDRWI